MLAYAWICRAVEPKLICFYNGCKKNRSLSQNKIDGITSIYQAELNYWKEVALKNLDEKDANGLKDSTPPSLFLPRKARKNAREINIDEIIHYLRLQYSEDENQIRLIQRLEASILWKEYLKK